MLHIEPQTTGGVTLYVRTGGNYEKWDRGMLAEVQSQYLWHRLPADQIRTAIDIGAHIGTWTLTMKRHAPHAEIAAVEPCDENMLLLRLNTDDEPGVSVHHAGCWYAEDYDAEKFALIISDENSGNHQFVRRIGGSVLNSGATRFQKMPGVVQIEDLMSLRRWKTIDVLKLDCEGSEFNILDNVWDETLVATHWIVGEHHSTVEEFAATAGARLGQTHNIHYIPHPEVLHLGMFFAENRQWPPLSTSA